MLELSKINTSSGTQARLSINQDAVRDYKEAYLSGANMPPVVIFFDGANHYLADGFHRFWGAKEAGLTEIYEEIIPGTLRDAILYSCGCNDTHGLRRKNEEKRKAVETLLSDPEWAEWSENLIAKTCHVSNHLVAEIKKSIKNNELSKNPHLENSKLENVTLNSPGGNTSRTYKTKHGTTATMNTSNINNKSKPEPTATPAPTTTTCQEILDDLSDFDPKAHEIMELKDTINMLVDKNYELEASAALRDTSEAGESATQQVIDGLKKEIDHLKKEIDNLNVDLRAVTISRDGLLNDNTDLKKVVANMRSRLKKAGG